VFLLQAIRRFNAAAAGIARAGQRFGQNGRASQEHRRAAAAALVQLDLAGMGVPAVTLRRDGILFPMMMGATGLCPTRLTHTEDGITAGSKIIAALIARIVTSFYEAHPVMLPWVPSMVLE